MTCCFCPMCSDFVLALTMPHWPLSFLPSNVREGGNSGGGTRTGYSATAREQATSRFPLHPSKSCRAHRLARPGQARYGHRHGCSLLAGRHGRHRVLAALPFTELNERHRRLSQALPHVARFITGLLRRCGTAAMASPPPRLLPAAVASHHRGHGYWAAGARSQQATAHLPPSRGRDYVGLALLVSRPLPLLAGPASHSPAASNRGITREQGLRIRQARE